MPTAYVNNQPVEFGAEERLNCIQAAQRIGFEIPSYCWHPALSVVASCRMCLVEIGQQKPDGQIVMEPLTDRLTEQQIQSPNVVVAYAWYARGSGNEKYNIEFVYRKRGRAQVFRDGMMVEGFWLAADSTSPLQFIDSVGNPLPLKPGATWIEVVGENSTPTETAPGEWNVRFRFP